MVVEDPTFHVSLKQIGVSGLDKFKGLLTGEAKKPSLRMPAIYLKDKIVTRDQVLKPHPISFNLQENRLNGQQLDKLISLQKNFNPHKAVGSSDFELTKLKGNSEFVYKPKNLDVFSH